jgi:drug/metabolite transporter (DMT)-like permease
MFLTADLIFRAFNGARAKNSCRFHSPRIPVFRIGGGIPSLHQLRVGHEGKEKHHGRAALALGAAFLWGIQGPAGRYLALNGTDMLFVAALRFIIGTIVIGIFLAWRRAVTLEFMKQWKLLLAISIPGLFTNSVACQLALKYMPATLVMIIENLSPVFVFLLTIVFTSIIEIIFLDLRLNLSIIAGGSLIILAGNMISSGRLKNLKASVSRGSGPDIHDGGA